VHCGYVKNVLITNGRNTDSARKPYFVKSNRFEYRIMPPHVVKKRERRDVKSRVSPWPDLSDFQEQRNIIKVIRKFSALNRVLNVSTVTQRNIVN